MVVFTYGLALIWLGLGAYGVVTACTRNEFIFAGLAVTNGGVFGLIATLFNHTHDSKKPE